MGHMHALQRVLRLVRIEGFFSHRQFHEHAAGRNPRKFLSRSGTGRTKLFTGFAMKILISTDGLLQVSHTHAHALSLGEALQPPAIPG